MEYYCIKCLHLKINSINQKQGKYKQVKHKVGRIKKIIWIRTEVKEIENNRKTNQVFLKKINKIDKPLAI